jgi:hypothetical protein
MGFEVLGFGVLRVGLWCGFGMGHGVWMWMLTRIERRVSQKPNGCITSARRSEMPKDPGPPT